MIGYLRGTVTDTGERELVVDVGGVGYSVYTTLADTPIGTLITLYTHLVIRDDAHELYGFSVKEERELFRTLIGVSGVGPKTALGMLSLYTLPDLVSLIKHSDAKAIALVPGIGKKTAEKVVIDLKDKVAKFASAEHGASSDLVEALLSLGYKEFQIRPVAGLIDPTLPIEKQITEALQKIQK